MPLPFTASSSGNNCGHLREMKKCYPRKTAAHQLAFPGFTPAPNRGHSVKLVSQSHPLFLVFPNWNVPQWQRAHAKIKHMSSTTKSLSLPVTVGTSPTATPHTPHPTHSLSNAGREAESRERKRKGILKDKLRVSQTLLWLPTFPPGKWHFQSLCIEAY